MRTFKHFNKAGKCPICGTNKDGETVLIPIQGTGDGHISEAVQIHLDCIDLTYLPKADGGYLFQQIQRGGND